MSDESETGPVNLNEAKLDSLSGTWVAERQRLRDEIERYRDALEQIASDGADPGQASIALNALQTTPTPTRRR